jgi:cytochrome c oxidase subunit 2
VLAVIVAVAGCARQVADVPAPAAQPQRGAAASPLRGNLIRGETLFGEKGCIGCHTVQGIGGQVGPTLTEVARRDLAAERPGGTWPDVVAYIEESIRSPQAYIVPGFPTPSPMPSAEQFGLTDQDINDLIAYLLSLAKP